MPRPNTTRVESVLRATARWRKDLVDTSGRNPLRRYRDLKTSTLDLTPDGAAGLSLQALDRLLAGKTVGLHDLFPRTPPLWTRLPADSNGLPPFDDARRRLSAIHKRVREDAEEKGIDTCFAAIGLATWKVEQGSPPNAPVVLLPLGVEATGAAARDFRLTVAGDAHLNPVLTDVLYRDHGIATDDEADIAESPPASFAGFRALLDQREKSWGNLPELRIEPRIVVARFSYSTMPLVADLGKNGEHFAENDLVAAIAGNEEACRALAERICDPAPNQPDLDPAADEFLVLDADSSQHLAINRVLGGESLVVQGPPGTGKSQTIANLIATLVARGKRVLFVAEKRAAIEAVAKRLEQVGLSDLVMDMHGGVTSRREFARTLAASLKQVSAIPKPDFSKTHRRLQECRDALAANDAALHELRNPWKLSVFQMRERLLSVPQDARTGVRLSRAAARQLDRDSYDELAAKLEEWVGLKGHELAESHPEWSRSGITTTEEVRDALDRIRNLHDEQLPATRDALYSGLDEVGVARPDNVHEWQRAADFFARVARTHETCHAKIYRLDLEATQRAIAPAAQGVLKRLIAHVFSSDYRSAKRAVRAAVRESKMLRNSEVLPLLKDVADQRDEWTERRVDDGAPRTPRELEQINEHLDALTGGLNGLKAILLRNDLDKLHHGELAGMMARLIDTRLIAANLPRIRELEAVFRKAGIEDVIEHIGRNVPAGLAAHTVEHAWLLRILDDLEIEDSRLAAFDGDRLSGQRDDFAELDQAHLESTPQRVRRLTAETIVATMNEYPRETALVRREAEKGRRHLSVRQLFAQAPHVLSALRPCWTMSPILVAEMIPPDRPLFDVVIFDEASQIPPAEAIGCLARAPQAVIAGDSRQLPPTAFFGRGADDDEEEEDHGDDEHGPPLTSDIESLLGVADVLLRDQMLLWHYRSRDDRLIAFSNRHIYGGALTAFPGAMVRSPLSHCEIPFRPILGTSRTRSNPDEVEKVVDLALTHARERPRETLGVIAFGQAHANGIENALQRRLSEMSDASLDEFFSETNEERFFVKNIERVQGDERDAIILSVGYHKDANEQLPYRFGPLNQEGGERRLNVAVSRARSRLMLVSSFTHRDMDPGRSSAKGVELLRRYIEYAASGGDDLGSGVQDVPLNPFELSVRDGLERRRIPFVPQYGVSGYRIDFACAHPGEPGRMVLAIEADGASYHSAPTARDRDRLRQQVLEGKGWRFHRIWSTDWFRNRERELDRVKEAWEQAVDAPVGDTAQPVPPRPSRDPARPATVASPKRGPRPHVPRKGTWGRNTIADYPPRELVALAEWIMSDTLLRTDDKLMRALMDELGFTRSGSRIKRALTQAIKEARSRSSGRQPDPPRGPGTRGFRRPR